jgi:NADH dehydrogenase [ubiquinone] 1 alpha subcomplex assembly factor 7
MIRRSLGAKVVRNATVSVVGMIRLPHGQHLGQEELCLIPKGWHQFQFQFQHQHHRCRFSRAIVRDFATSSKKKALQEQQKKKSRIDDDAKSSPTTREPKFDPTIQQPFVEPKRSAATSSSKPTATTRLPGSLMIRTDFFGAASSSSQDLMLPSGYEVSTTSTGISNDDDDLLATMSDNMAASAYVDYKDLYDPKVHLPSAPQDWSNYEPATPLCQELVAQIGVLGRPMTVAEFMHHALLHPHHGYYSQPSRSRAEEERDDDFDDNDDDDWMREEQHANKDNPIFGPRGDFVTAPEICQVFGESIQVWMATQWEAMKRPRAIQMVEFGPGRGTLMADMVRFAFRMSSSSNGNEIITSDKLQHYGKALKVIHLIEPSHPLRAQQQTTLQEQLSDIVQWKFHDRDDGLVKTMQEESANATTKDTEPLTTTTATIKPTIHVYWHDSLGALSAMIMKQKPDLTGLTPPDPGSNEDEDDYNLGTMPLMIVCQELFDALPVHAFEMTQDGWRERMVDVAIQDELLEEQQQHSDQKAQSANSSSSSKSILDGQKRPRLRIVLAPEVTPALKTLLQVDAEGKILGDAGSSVMADVGQVVEVCPEGIVLIQEIAAMLERQGGAALVIDYGEEGSTDSLRGFWKHKQTHFLSLPGQIDVTADVDFTALKHAVNFARTRRMQQRQETLGDVSDPIETVDDKPVKATITAYGPIPQGQFLVAMGAKDRVIRCIESDATSEEEAENLFHALERLVSPEQMGIRYKVLSVTPQRYSSDGSFTVPPAGF